VWPRTFSARFTCTMTPSRISPVSGIKEDIVESPNKVVYMYIYVQMYIYVYLYLNEVVHILICVHIFASCVCMICMQSMRKRQMV